MKKYILIGTLGFLVIQGISASINDLAYNYGHKSVDTMASYDNMSTEEAIIKVLNED